MGEGNLVCNNLHDSAPDPPAQFQETPRTCRNFIALAMEGKLLPFVISQVLDFSATTQDTMTE